MAVSYKHCVILPYSGNLEGFQKSVRSLEDAECFQETLIIVPSIGTEQIYLYEHDKAVFDFMNMDNVISINGNGVFIDEIKKAMVSYGCNDVLLLREGDEIDPSLLAYIGYFEEAEDCGVVFPMPEDVGMHSLAEYGKLPDSLKFAAIIDTAALISGWDSECADIYEAYNLVVLKIVLNQGHFGSICVTQASKDTGYSASLLEKLLKRCETSQYLEEKIAAYVKNGMTETCAAAKTLLRYVSGMDETGKDKPELCITDIYNTGKYTEICGKVSTEKAKLKTDAALISFELTAADTAEDIQSVGFRAVLNLKDNKAGLSFTNGRSRINRINLENVSRNYRATVTGGVLNIEKVAPRNYYTVSVIMPVYNSEKYLDEAIKSVCAQSLGFLREIQLVLIDDGSTDNSAEICMDYQAKYPYNVVFKRIKHQGVSAARNIGLRHAVGKYVSFMDSDDVLEPDLLKTGVAYLETSKAVDIAAFPLKYFGEEQNKVPGLNFRFKRTAEISVEEQYNYLQSSACGVLIRAELLEGKTFDEHLDYSEDTEFMHRLILEKMRYAVLEKPCYLYRTRGGSAMRQRTKTEGWYEKLRYFGEAIISYSIRKYGVATKYTQQLLIHDLRDALNSDAVAEDGIFDDIARSLGSVSDSIILEDESLSYWFRLYLLKLKHGGDSCLRVNGGQIEFVYGGNIETIKPEMSIDSVLIRNGAVRINGRCELPDYDGELTITATGGATARMLDSGMAVTFIGRAVHKSMDFELELQAPNGEIGFSIGLEGTSIPLRIRASSGEFYTDGNILLCQGDNVLTAETATLSRIEAVFAASLENYDSGHKAEAEKIFEDYKRLYPAMRRSRQWLFIDSPQNLQLFLACDDKNDGVEKHLIVAKNTLDTLKMAEEGRSIAEYNSDTHILLYLFAEKVISQNISRVVWNPLEKRGLGEIFRAFCNSELVYVPESVLTKAMADELGGIGRKSCIVLASEREREILPVLLKDRAYVTGLPKYDMLEDMAERKILLMPSFKESPENNKDFDSSEYYIGLNELLCDERLMDAVEEYEYTFCFAPHPATYAQITDYDMDDIVDLIVPLKPCEVLAQECALLVTDYMPAYDFEWFGRPVIRYRFTGEWDSGGLDAGIGVEVSELEALVDLLIEFMRDGQLSVESVEFFGYRDTNNKERIYRLLAKS